VKGVRPKAEGETLRMQDGVPQLQRGIPRLRDEKLKFKILKDYITAFFTQRVLGAMKEGLESREPVCLDETISYMD